MGTRVVTGVEGFSVKYYLARTSELWRQSGSGLTACCWSNADVDVVEIFDIVDRQVARVNGRFGAASLEPPVAAFNRMTCDAHERCGYGHGTGRAVALHDQKRWRMPMASVLPLLLLVSLSFITTE